jgi:hypothetical protein
LIEGPSPVIKQIKEPVKVNIPFDNIDERFMEDVEVQLPSSDVIKRDPPTVAVMFDVDELVTVRDSVRLRIINLPSSIWPVMGRKRIPLIAAIPRSMASNFNLDSVSAVLDLEDVKRGERMIAPEVKGLPPFSKVIHIDSVRVKF